MGSVMNCREALARVIKGLETLIFEATWRKETRLPSERELATAFVASRATVREAIQRLVTRGLVETRRGSGLFVKARTPAHLRAPWLQLITESPPVRDDTLEFRLVFECAAARFAAQRATSDELTTLASILNRMHRAVQAQDVEAEAQADTEFHSMLAVASHNLMLSHYHASVIALLRENIMTNTYDASLIDVDPNRFAFARLDQHKAIFQAITTRRPDIAFEEMYKHIKFVAAQFGTAVNA